MTPPLEQRCRDSPEHANQDDDTNPEQHSLVPSGQDPEVPSRSNLRLVPVSLTVAGDNAEVVPARREAGVIGAPARARIVQRMIITFHSIAELDSLRNRHPSCRVIDLKIAALRGNASSLRSRGLSAIDAYGFDQYPRRDAGWKIAGVYAGHATVSRHPDSPVQ